MLISPYNAPLGIRTLTIMILNHSPLPIGIKELMAERQGIEPCRLLRHPGFQDLFLTIRVRSTLLIHNFELFYGFLTSFRIDGRRPTPPLDIVVSFSSLETTCCAKRFSHSRCTSTDCVDVVMNQMVPEVGFEPTLTSS